MTVTRQRFEMHLIVKSAGKYSSREEVSQTVRMKMNVLFSQFSNQTIPEASLLNYFRPKGAPESEKT